jgi:hypothetical protein
MKRTISLFLVASVIVISTPLSAKERKGADVIIQKKDGIQLRGELIAVKENSLLLLDRESGGDVTVDVEEIIVITTVKKSKYLLGAGLGFLIGAAAGATFIAVKGVNDSYLGWMGLSAAVLGSAGALLGFIFVAFTASGKTKVIQIEGKSDAEIQKILEKLRKKARIKNAR